MSNFLIVAIVVIVLIFFFCSNVNRDRRRQQQLGLASSQFQQRAPRSGRSARTRQLNGSGLAPGLVAEQPLNGQGNGNGTGTGTEQVIGPVDVVPVEGGVLISPIDEVVFDDEVPPESLIEGFDPFELPEDLDTGDVDPLTEVFDTPGDVIVTNLSTPNPLDVPPFSAYSPLRSAPNRNFVYFAQRNAYLLPCDQLNFNRPFDRWMYYYFPEYYYDCYDRVWPFDYPRRFYYGYYDPFYRRGYYGPSYGSTFWRYYRNNPTRYRRYLPRYRQYRRGASRPRTVRASPGSRPVLRSRSSSPVRRVPRSQISSIRPGSGGRFSQAFSRPASTSRSGWSRSPTRTGTVTRSASRGSGRTGRGSGGRRERFEVEGDVAQVLPFDQSENVWESQNFSFENDSEFCDENDFGQDDELTGVSADPVPFSGPAQRVNQFA